MTISFALLSVWGGVEDLKCLGSLEKVQAYCLSNSHILVLDVYQNTSNSWISVGSTTDDRLSFTNMDQLNAFFQLRLNTAAKEALTTTNTSLDPEENAPVDRDKPFQIYASVEKYTDEYHPVYFTCPGSFNLIKTNGSYMLPDLSGIKLKLHPWVPFEIDRLGWARVETSYASHPDAPFEVFDPRYNPNVQETGIYPYPDLSRIYIRRDFAVSGTNGPFRMKIYVVSGADDNYHIFDGNGTQLPETPKVMSIIRNTVDPSKPQASSSSSLVSLNITGGDPGRVVVLQRTTDMTSWEDMGNYVIPDDKSGISVPVGTDGNMSFYRLFTTNTVP